MKICKQKTCICRLTKGFLTHWTKKIHNTAILESAVLCFTLTQLCWSIFNIKVDLHKLFSFHFRVYMSEKLFMHSSNFQCAIVVLFLSSWRHYNAIFVSLNSTMMFKIAVHVLCILFLLFAIICSSSFIFNDIIEKYFYLCLQDEIFYSNLNEWLSWQFLFLLPIS